MTQIHPCLVGALLACAGLSCSGELPDSPKKKSTLKAEVIEIPVGEQKAIFRRISPSVYGIDYPAYYLLETEVTNRMFREYLRATGKSKDDTEVLKIVQKRAPKATTSPDGTLHVEFWSASHQTPYSVNDETTIWHDGEYPAGLDDYPVALLSLEDAQEFCNWLTENHSDQGLFRLPTWNEWMIAAFGSSRGYPWGDKWYRSMTHTWYGYSWDDRPIRAEPVKARPLARTPEGLFGMIGNVSEYLIDGDPANKGFFNLNARWMGGGFEDGMPRDSDAQTREELPPRKDYWGYNHDSASREDHLGFRVLLDVKKNRSLVERAPVFPQQDNEWRTDSE